MKDIGMSDEASRTALAEHLAEVIRSDDKKRNGERALKWVFIFGCIAALAVVLWPLDSLRFSVAFGIVWALVTVYGEL